MGTGMAGMGTGIAGMGTGLNAGAPSAFGSVIGGREDRGLRKNVIGQFLSELMSLLT